MYIILMLPQFSRSIRCFIAGIKTVLWRHCVGRAAETRQAYSQVQNKRVGPNERVLRVERLWKFLKEGRPNE